MRKLLSVLSLLCFLFLKDSFEKKLVVVHGLSSVVRPADQLIKRI